MCFFLDFDDVIFNEMNIVPFSGKKKKFPVHNGIVIFKRSLIIHLEFIFKILFWSDVTGLIPVPLTEASKDKEARMWLRSYLRSEIRLFEDVRRKLLSVPTVIPYP